MKKIFVFLLVINIFGCSDREFSNPYDPFTKFEVKPSLSYTGTELNILKINLNNLDERSFKRYEIFYSQDIEIKPDYKYLYKVITKYDSTSIFLSNLKENETYYFIVRIIDVLDREVVSEPLKVVSGNDFPPKPVFSNSIEVLYNKITLKWNQINIKDFLKYEIFFSTINGFPLSNINLLKTITKKDDTTLIVENLKPNTIYYFKLRVYDIGNLFTDSDEKAIITGNDIPTSIVLNDITNPTDSSLTLNWTKNTDDDFLKYEIHYSNSANFTISSQTLVKTIYDRDITDITIANLLPSRKYYFKIRVYDKGGLYSDSNEKYAQTLAPSGSDVPKPVTLDLPSEITQTTMRITWSLYTGSDFKHYELHYSTEENFVLSSSNIYLGALTNQNLKSIVVLGLNPNTKYYFRMRVVNNKDKFADSEEVSASTLP
jgi:predicted phage tail protein